MPFIYFHPIAALQNSAMVVSDISILQLAVFQQPC